MEKKKTYNMLFLIALFVSFVIVAMWITNSINATILLNKLEASKNFVSQHWEVIVAFIGSFGVVWMIFSTRSQRKHERAMQQVQNEHEMELKRLELEYNENIRRQAKDSVRAIKMLEGFINPLINRLGKEMSDIDDSLDSGRFGWTMTKIRPNYDFIYARILGNENDIWVREKVDENNKLVDAINKTSHEFEQAIEKLVKHIVSKDIELSKNDLRFLVFSIANNDRTFTNNTEGVYGFWNERIDEFLAVRADANILDKEDELKQCLIKAKEIATELKNKLSDLKGAIYEICDVWEPEIEGDEKKDKVVVIRT